jgi:hypothetical protein
MQEPSRPGVEPWFAYTVGLLLLLVVAALTGLSLRLYTRARAAEGRAAMAQSRLDQQQGALSLLGEHLTELSFRLDRRKLPARPARLDDREITLLEASAAQGEQVGLMPGDVLYVSARPPAASAPVGSSTTAPGASSTAPVATEGP